MDQLIFYTHFINNQGEHETLREVITFEVVEKIFANAPQPLYNNEIKEKEWKNIPICICNAIRVLKE